MFSFLFLIAILAFLTQAEDTCPLYKYYTSNTFLARGPLSYTCYGIDSDCEVYYSPLGVGCAQSSLQFIGTIPKNETMVIRPNIFLDPGGGFCSNNEIVVSFLSDTPHAKTDLPRATEAGTNFHIALLGNDTYGTRYKCGIATLSLPAQVNLVLTDYKISLTIDSFQFQQVYLRQQISSAMIVKIVSSNPIIVSCYAETILIPFFTLQPISSERLLVATAGHTIVTVLLSDCSTNEMITDFSLVNVAYSQLSGDACDPVQVKEEFGTQAYYFTAECIVSIQATDGVCVSAMKQVNNHFLADMGLPESKFSTRFLHFDLDDTFFQFSFFKASCIGYRTSDSTVAFDKEWLNGDLDGQLANKLSESALNDFTSLDCFAPTFLVVNDVSAGFPFILGSQSEDLWKFFFGSECPEPPTEAPVEPPGEEPPSEEPPSEPPTQSPETPSSDAPSMTFCINWIPLSALFGLNLFSSILV